MLLYVPIPVPIHGLCKTALNAKPLCMHICRHGVCFRLLRACGAAPQPGLLDLARLSLQPPSYLLSFNPFLSLASCERLVEGARVWMQLCVLEDRLNRILVLAKAGEEFKPLLIQVKALM